jgi:hypothetical protein
MSNKVLGKEGKLTRLDHVYWSKTSTKENSIFGNFGFPAGMPIPAIFLSGIFFKFSHNFLPDCKAGEKWWNLSFLHLLFVKFCHFLLLQMRIILFSSFIECPTLRSNFKHVVAALRGFHLF